MFRGKRVHAVTGKVEPLAVKRVKLGDARVAAAAEREAGFLRRLNGHENIVRLVCCMRQGGALHLCLEMCATDLNEWVMDRRAAAGEAVIREIARQLAKAVGAVHALGIVHRDIKPKNILLTPDAGGRWPYTLKLCDFGLAAEVTDRMMTTMCGTPHNMAPEMVVNADSYDRSVDLYSFGTVLYFVATKTPPMLAKTIPDLRSKMRTLVDERRELPLVYRVTASATFRDLCSKLLRRDPAERLTLDEVQRHPFVVDATGSVEYVVVDHTAAADSELSVVAADRELDTDAQRDFRRRAEHAVRRYLALTWAARRRVHDPGNRRAVLVFARDLISDDLRALSSAVAGACPATRSVIGKLRACEAEARQLLGAGAEPSDPPPPVDLATVATVLRDAAIEPLREAEAAADDAKVADAIASIITLIERALPPAPLVECSRVLDGSGASTVATAAPIAIPKPAITMAARFCYNCGARFTGRFNTQVCACGYPRHNATL